MKNSSSLSPPPEKMNHPDAKPGSGNGYHYLQFVFFQIPYAGLQGPAKEVTSSPYRSGPE